MRVVNYDEVNIPDELDSLALELRRTLVPRIKSHRSNDQARESNARSALYQLPYILWGVSGEVRGKTILDLGCGSNQPSLEGGGIFNDSTYEPWLCRGLHLLGANPIGVDIGSLDGEEFTHHQVDLSRLDSLKEIPDGSVDLANAKQLFSSPFLIRFTKTNPEDLRRNLHTQLERVLKPEAVFLYWD